MEILATFIGQNSLGYEHGKEYRLKINTYRGMEIRRMDNTGQCPYSSISAFLRNWDNIKRV
jgi:hypothetical protein